jgi:hypothetical protein
MYTILHIKMYANQKINFKFFYFLKYTKKNSTPVWDAVLTIKSKS